MSDIKKILVGVDGSSHSKKAVNYAIRLGELEHAELAIVYAVGDIRDKEVIVELGTKYGSKAVLRRVYENSKKSAMEWMAPLERQASKKGIKASMQVIFEPGKSIVELLVDYAEKNGFDLIVVGTRGRSRFKRMLLGSVAAGIISHAHCSVTVVR